MYVLVISAAVAILTPFIVDVRTMVIPTDIRENTESLFAEVLRAIKKVETSMDEKLHNQLSRSPAQNVRLLRLETECIDCPRQYDVIIA